jgi:hypothetical protein
MTGGLDGAPAIRYSVNTRYPACRFKKEDGESQVNV